MTALEECAAQAERLRARMREYQAELKEAADPKRHAALQAKIAAIRAALKDVQVQLDHLDPPQKHRPQRARRRRLDVGDMPFDWFERNHAVWSDLEGCTWNQAEAGDAVEAGASMEQLRGWLAEGAQRLTGHQRLYIDAYYNQGFSMERIAREYGVSKSTVSRTIQRGLARMRKWVEAKRFTAACADGRGGFEWAEYLAQVPGLTDRQRQLMLLALFRTQKELAERLGVDKSTVSRTLGRAWQTIRRLGIQGRPLSPCGDTGDVILQRLVTCYADP